jgi:Caspase domain
MTPTIPYWFRDRGIGGPATHALVIGTSTYPHRPFQLNDLPASALSAFRFATWLRGSYAPPEAPIASIRLLLAPTERERRLLGADPNIMLPNRLNVMAALGEWQQDCLGAADNVAVLYACGHGLQETDDGGVVLVHDAGIQAGNPLDEGLDIEGVRRGLKGPNSPRHQWYFVDACRIDEKKLDDFDTLDGGIVLGRRRGEAPPHRPVFFSAEPGKRSFQSEKGTVFSRSLLDCLRFHALEPFLGGGDMWRVTGPTLLTALRQRVPVVARAGSRYQQINIGGSMTDATFTNAPAPQVPFTVEASPRDVEREASCGAELFDGNTAVRVMQRRPLPVQEVPVRAGIWTLSVTFDPPHTVYRDKPSVAIYVRPPSCSAPVNLQ